MPPDKKSGKWTNSGLESQPKLCLDQKVYQSKTFFKHQYQLRYMSSLSHKRAATPAIFHSWLVNELLEVRHALKNGFKLQRYQFQLLTLHPRDPTEP